MVDPDVEALATRVRDARRRSGLSQNELGTAVGLERSVVNKIEAGVRRISALELSDIARALDVPMSTFFVGPPAALVSHRAHQGPDVADSRIDALLAACTQDVEFVGALTPIDHGPVAAELAGGTVAPSTLSEAEELATRARRWMGESEAGPILRLSDAVARAGLLAFSVDVGNDTADAGTILLDRGGVSLVNSHTKVGRRRLALAHELGHYVVADDYTVDWRVGDRSERDTTIESRLDRFARAILLPAAGLAERWIDLVDRRGERGASVTVASEFRVDMSTLVSRLVELGLVESEAAGRLRRVRTGKADIVEFDLHVPLEELAGTSVPRPFAQAVLRLVRDEKISRERALDLLRGTFDQTDLPPRRARRAEDIWAFVS